jgi:NADH-quinone oxidoreductase subunit J
MELLIFSGLALVAAVSGLLVIVQRHAVYSALFLVITMGALAGIYILLDAHFVWVIQVIVYAGAIMVLFLFVIMLLDIQREPAPWAPPDRGRIVAAILLSVVLLVELGMAVGQRLLPDSAGVPTAPRSFGTTQTVGRLLFTDYLFPFEITSIILLVAMVGAMVLAKKHQ